MRKKQNITIFPVFHQGHNVGRKKNMNTKIVELNNIIKHKIFKQI
jgi:hypothetical protein